MVQEPFTISLADLESIDLRVKPTSNHFQHLVIEGDAVNILKLDYRIFERLRIIKNDRMSFFLRQERIEMVNIGQCRRASTSELLR